MSSKQSYRFCAKIITFLPPARRGWYFPAFSWVLRKWLAESCRVSVRCLSACPCLSASQRGALAQWYGTPVKSKYATRRKNSRRRRREYSVPI